MLSKVIRGSFLVAPALLGIVLVASAAIATETQSPSDAEALSTELISISEFPSTFEQNQFGLTATSEQVAQILTELPASIEQNFPVADSAEDTTSSDALAQIIQYGSEASDETQAQVTSISQLSDVQPTDWAFQALQNLVERYGCIAGYPDGTYRGRQATTRYEFAAGLNACLDRVNELIAAGLADAVTREDLATLQRLQEEFAAELATLRGRVDGLEARTAELEANQFSTTTKLNGTTQFLISGVIDEDESFDDQIVFLNRVRLNFDTSFTGTDRLRVRFQARNITQFDGDSIGFQAGGSDNSNDFILDDLVYSFTVGDRANIIVGLNGLDIDDFTASIVTPHGQSSDNQAISEFADPRQYEQAFAGTGAGAGARVRLIQSNDLTLSLDFGYVGDEAESPLEGNGLFNGDYSAIGQLTLLTDFVDAAITYVNSYDDSAFDVGIYDVDGPAVGNTYGAQVNFKFGPFQLGGGGSFTDVSGLGDRPDYDLWSYQATLAITDLGGDGNQFGVLAGVPSYTRDLVGQSRDTGFLTEVYYRYNLNDNISLTPSVIWLVDPFNNNDNDDTFIGTFRTTFRF